MSMKSNDEIFHNDLMNAFNDTTWMLGARIQSKECITCKNTSRSTHRIQIDDEVCYLCANCWDAQN